MKASIATVATDVCAHPAKMHRRRRRGPGEQVSRAKDALLVRKDGQRVRAVLLRKRRLWKEGRMVAAIAEDGGRACQSDRDDAERRAPLDPAPDDWEHVEPGTFAPSEAASIYKRIATWVRRLFRVGGQ